MSPERKERSEPIGARLPECFLPLQREFFTSVLSGNPRQPTNDEVQRSVEAQFAYQPLVTLTALEEQNLFQEAIQRETKLYEHTRWKLIAGPTYYEHREIPEILNDGRTYLERKDIFYVGEGAATGKSLGLHPLTPHEKEKLLTDPYLYDFAELSEQRGGIGLYNYGTRNLTVEQQPPVRAEFFANANYGYTVADFQGILQTVRTAQGKTPHDKLRGLDIGGSNAMAAHDAEQLDRNLDMTNITVTPELAFWPLRGGSRLLPAERLPADFAGQFDIVLSNYAFPYMRYPDLGLENGLTALSLGGIMSIGFDSGRNQAAVAEFDEMTDRIDRQFQHMEDLVAQGRVRYLPLWRPDLKDAREAWKDDPEDVHGQVFLQKVA